VNIIIISSNVTCSRHDMAEIFLIYLQTTIAHSLKSFKSNYMVLIVINLQVNLKTWKMIVRTK